MITYVRGSLFRSPAHVLVNTVNTVGVMGKGVAKEFKRLFPDMYRQYRDLCEQKKFDIGNLFLYKTDNKWVLNFPTKKHWRSPSRPEYIEHGLQKLVSNYLDLGIYDLAMPLLGCGNGELDWPTQVEPIFKRYLKNLPINVFVYLYAPSKEPIPEHRNVASMERWLRSEPEHLPFSEVWLDLLHLLEKKTEFQTLAGKNNKFQASASEEPKGILIRSRGRAAFVDAADLSDFWQQLRSYGFTSRQIAPSGLSRKAYYLMPIFADLNYVKAANISESYRRLRNGTETIGLQYIPQIRPVGLFNNRISVNL
ncbi:MAG: macro domain-containing protein [Acidobacteriota bacterium]|nr:macro domain-containing protein [Acidobacteriota bacterium]